MRIALLCVSLDARGVGVVELRAMTTAACLCGLAEVCVVDALFFSVLPVSSWLFASSTAVVLGGDSVGGVTLVQYVTVDFGGLQAYRHGMQRSALCCCPVALSECPDVLSYITAHPWRLVCCASTRRV